MASGGFLRPALLALLVLAPLPFGSVEDWSRWLLITLTGALFACFLWARIPFALERREKIAFGFAGAYLLWLGIQMIPLPPALLSRLSPAAHRLYQIAVPGYGDTDPIGYSYPDPAALAALQERIRTDPEGTWTPPHIAWVTPSFSLRRPLSLYPYGTYRVLCQTAAMLAFLAMALALFRERRHCRQLTWTLVAAGSFQALYGIFETLSGRHQIFWYQKRHYIDVATGTLINRNHYAGMLNMILPLAIALALRSTSEETSLFRHLPARMRIVRALRSFGSHRTFLLFAATMMGLAVVLSRSRMGVISMLAGMLGLSISASFWGRNRSPSGSPRPLWGIALPLGILFLVAAYALALDPAPVAERFFKLREDLEATAVRPALWRESLTAAERFRWIGAGAGAYPFAMNPNLKTLELGDFWLYDHAHNDYLEAAVTLGFPGLLAAVPAIGLLCVRRPQSRISLAALAGLLTLWAHSGADFLLAIPSNAAIAMALLCLVAGGSRQAPPIEPSASTGRGREALSLLSFVVILAATAAWPARCLIAAAVHRPYSNSPPWLPSAVASARLASSIDPSSDLYARRLAEAQYEAPVSIQRRPIDLSQDLIRQALDSRLRSAVEVVTSHTNLLRVLELSPVNFSLHGMLARTRTRLLQEAPGLFSPAPESSPAPASLSPYVASSALAPTSRINQAELGLVLWHRRDLLGEPAGSLALDLLARSQSLWRSRPAWFIQILQLAEDAESLSQIDQMLRPPARAYRTLLGSQFFEDRPELYERVVALRARAEEREFGR